MNQEKSNPTYASQNQMIFVTLQLLTDKLKTRTF